MKRILLPLTALLCGLNIQGAEGFLLVQNQKPQSAIVIPDKPNKVELYAARELQYHFMLISKAQLPIISEGKTNPKQPMIYLGDTRFARAKGIISSKLERNTYVIKSGPDFLILAGRDGGTTGTDGFTRAALPKNDNISQGTLLAVHRYLDTEHSVRWLWPGELGTFAPEKKTLYSGKPQNLTLRPALMHNRIRFYVAPDKFSRGAGLSDAECNKLYNEVFTLLNRHGMVRTERLEYGHAFENYWNRFSKSDPNFFAQLASGKREPAAKIPKHVQLCVTNHRLHKQIIDDYIALRKHQKDKRFINGAENDKAVMDSFCHCEQCKKWGTLSDRYAKFWKELRKEALSRNIDAPVLGYAYADYAEPPLETKLDKNFLIAIVPKFHYPLDADKSKRFRKLWSDWKATGASLYLRPNYMLQGYALPYIFAREFGEDFKFATAHGLQATDFDSLTAMWSVQGLNLYMLLRLHQRNDLTTNEVLDEYYSAFGNGKKEIQKYFEHFETVTRRRTDAFDEAHKVGGWNRMGWVGDLIFTPETVQEGFAYLDKALQAVPPQSAEAKRIEFLKSGLTHAKLALETMTLYRIYKQNPKAAGKKAAFEAALKKLDDYRSTIKLTHAVNLPLLRRLEMWSGWKRPPK